MHIMNDSAQPMWGLDYCTRLQWSACGKWGWGEGGRGIYIYTSVTLGNRKGGAQLEVMSKEIACTFNDGT